MEKENKNIKKNESKQSKGKELYHFTKVYNILGRKVQFIYFRTYSYHKIIKLTYIVTKLHGKGNKNYCINNAHKKTSIYIYSPMSMFAKKIVNK